MGLGFVTSSSHQISVFEVKQSKADSQPRLLSGEQHIVRADEWVWRPDIDIVLVFFLLTSSPPPLLSDPLFLPYPNFSSKGEKAWFGEKWEGNMVRDQTQL